MRQAQALAQQSRQAQQSQQAQHSDQRSALVILSELLGELSMARKMVDVNIAAGKARGDLLDLLVEGSEEPGELIDLSLEPL